MGNVTTGTETGEASPAEAIPKFETEIKNLGPTLVKIQTLIKIAFPGTEKIDQEEQVPDKPESVEPEKPLSSAEIKQRLDQIPAAIQVSENVFAESMEKITGEILPVIQQTDFSSADSTAGMNKTLDAAASTTQSVMDSRKNRYELEAEHKKLQKAYEQALLKEMNAELGKNFESFDQVIAAQPENARQFSRLGHERFGTGILFNRGKIKQLEIEDQKIYSFYDRWQQVRVRSIPYRNGYAESKAIQDAEINIIKPVFEKLLQRYDELAVEFQEQHPVAEESELPTLLKDSLDNDFINKCFLPYFKQAMDGYSASSPRSVDIWANPRHMQNAVNIVRQSLRIHHNETFTPVQGSPYPEDEAKNKEINHRLVELPTYVKDAITRFFGYPNYNWKPMEENYKTIADLARATQDIQSRIAQTDAQREFLEQIRKITGQDGLPFRPFYEICQTAFRKKDDLLDPEKKIDHMVNDFFGSMDHRIWLAFLNNPEARATFDSEQLESANYYLVRSLLKTIMKHVYFEYFGSPSSKVREQAGYRLMDFKSPTTIPLIILNAYRDPYHFIHGGTDLRQSRLYGFVSGLTEQELEQLKQENIPGLLPLIDLVKSNPNSQLLNSAILDKNGASRPDPVSEEIGRNLIEMSIYLLNKGDKGMEEFITSAFDAYPINMVIGFFSYLQQERGELPLYCSKALIRRLKASDPIFEKEYPDRYSTDYEDLSTDSQKRDSIIEARYKLFHQSIERLLKEINNPESNLYQNQEYYGNESVMRFIARQPERIEEVLNLPSLAPYLFSVLLKEGGPLYANKNKILENIFSNGSCLKRAKEVETIFSRKVPYWKQLYLFTDARIGEQLATASSQYPITEVLGIPVKTLVERHKAKLQAMIGNPEVVRQLESGEIDFVPFNEFTGMYKRLLFRDFLRKSVETSRSLEYKAKADKRNRLLSEEGFNIPDGTYIHGSAVDVLESVLLNGNLPQEALGESAGTDTYPFQTDFSCLTQEFMSKQPSTEKILTNSMSGGYGGRGALGSEGKLYYIYRRTADSYEAGKKFGPNIEHALILGGMPSTEISGIVLRNANVTLETVKKAVLENGFYIPVYDISGKLLFAPADYDLLRNELNYKIPVETWDFSLKTGEKLGSNPGGEFAVPTGQGSQKFYVKFANPESTDQVWNEQLADNIYRHLGIAVPDTKIVKTGTTYGHASRILPHDQQVNTDDFKNGFIADVLLADWDIVANSGNVISSDGKLIRIDNGGSLLFRAQGERKTGFGGIVTELESMKGSYPGLTQEDIRSQIAVLHERFTDSAIDNLVDSVRLSSKDRDYLKTTLRQRRDYIFSYYNSEVPVVELKEISEQAKVMDTFLKAESLDDVRLLAAIPEWGRLIGEEGYQHNKALLGEHIKIVLSTLKYLPEYWSLPEKEKSLALVATLFHDFGKPTGKKDEDVPRDFGHEVPSAQIAAEYMRKWGYSDNEIKTVVQIIINDGIVSDVVRGKVRDEKKNLTPGQFKEVLNNNVPAIKILRALNRADVVATVGANGYKSIEEAFNKYFDAALA